MINRQTILSKKYPKHVRVNLLQSWLGDLLAGTCRVVMSAQQ